MRRYLWTANGSGIVMGGLINRDGLPIPAWRGEGGPEGGVSLRKCVMSDGLVWLTVADEDGQEYTLREDYSQRQAIPMRGRPE